MIILAAYSDDRNSSVSNLISACIVVVASLVGIYSVRFKDRGGLQWTYLLFVWSISNGTTYLYNGLKDGSKLGSFCEDLEEAESDVSNLDSCQSQRAIATAQTVVAVFAFFVALANAWLVSNFSEKIQDEDNIAMRKRDIRFALAAQAQKIRTVRRWRKAYYDVSLSTMSKIAKRKEDMLGNASHPPGAHHHAKSEGAAPAAGMTQPPRVGAGPSHSAPPVPLPDLNPIHNNEVAP